jgi:hypothetical protein
MDKRLIFFNVLRRGITILFALQCSISLANSNHIGDSVKLFRGLWRERACFVSIGFGFANTEAVMGWTKNANISTAEPISILPRLPQHGKIEFFVSDHFGLGASISYSAVRFEYEKTVDPQIIDWSILTFNARVNYHFLYRQRFDVFIGSGAGLRQERYKTSNGKNYPTPTLVSGGVPFGFECTVGLRYSPIDLIGIYLEAGLSRSILQAGIFINPMAFKQ